jgi:hypothetical protein
MALNSTALNAMLDNLGTLVAYVSLHTDAVGGGTGNEVTGGSPAYARKAITWSSAAAGSKASSNSPVFDVPAGTTVRRVGFFSLVTGGTYYGDADITDETFAGQGTYTLTTTTLSLT